MRRLPIIATIIVVVAVAVMIGLGVWQLQRAAWKGRMLSELGAAQGLAPIDLDRLIAEGHDTPIAFRRATVTCQARDATVALRAGRNVRGTTGYSHFIPCRPGAAGLAGRLQINAGWSQSPNGALRLTADGPVAGIIGTADGDGPVILTAQTPIGPLQASTPPLIDDIPNNHLAYAFQWFFFAGTAALIFLLALRRRRSVAPPAATA
jgi:cytochrome oxidase assembly protein ShyY1